MAKKSDFIGFDEREKQHARVMKRLHEAYPMVGGASEDNMWRSLTTTANRDLNALTQKRMQDIAFYLYDSNPLAKRIVEIVRDFVVGEGFTYTAEDEDVLEVIDEFWNDPENNLDFEIDTNVLELSIFGENCFPVWVNPVDGSVKLGYIDPQLILKVRKDPSNPKINKTLEWKKQNTADGEKIDIINIDKRVTSKTYGRLIGDCFYFAINKVSGATRGRSDLLTLADWIDGYDQFLFARLERAFLMNAFIWDITCEGMTKADLDEFVKNISLPRSGSVRAHNEKITWKTETPKLEASDASEEARLFKNQILGGAGYPEHWFAEGSRTTRATALEMGLPTLKKLKSRQKFVKYQLIQIINFVIDQKIIAKQLKEDVNRRFKIIPSPILSRDNKGFADAINGFVDGLKKAQDFKWVTEHQAKTIFNTVVSQLGVDAESDAPEAGEEEETKDPETIDPIPTDPAAGQPEGDPNATQ